MKSPGSDLESGDFLFAVGGTHNSGGGLEFGAADGNKGGMVARLSAFLVRFVFLIQDSQTMLYKIRKAMNMAHGFSYKENLDSVSLSIST